RLQIIILSLLPFLCFGQFSIQGPSDGNRRAQGLKYSADKGVEYTDQAASLGTSGFSIQGASDGNSDFQIQGATDGNSDFHIQGASDGNAEFQIHGPTDGGSQAYLHNYGASQEEPQQPANQGRAIEYKDPSGHRVNWRSYNRAPSNPSPQQQYEEPTPRPVHRRPSHRRAQPQAARAEPQPQPQAQARPHAQAHPVAQPQYQAPVANINYNPIEKAPPSIQEILQFQAQIPYINIIPEHLRIDALSAAQAQANKFAEEYPKQVLAQQQSAELVIEEAPRSVYRSKPRQHQRSREQPRENSREQVRERRQAPTYTGYEERQQQPHAVPNQKSYGRLSQPPAEPVPQYSSNVPQQIQQILRYQAQIPYDVIANQIIYRLDKPYVPQPAQQPGLRSAQTQPIPAQYKPRPTNYQQDYVAEQAAAYPQQPPQQEHTQGQIRQTGNPYYDNQQRPVAQPVNERQY
ncbi:PREDICTED: mediator of RNA polymerase II transcription subunit 15-like, partial [Ceratosolen solmsi marchali]|uniref:Mediator of RNA polymerase II transcription subunit 15-like n=1 Tax=Ceratosolen solmsi marchali TaxID=326594 RepID=A0AAJ6YKZ6_9HYME